MCDGTYLKEHFLDEESKTYWFDKDGWMATGWQSIGGYWYYFRGSGAMATGWLEDGGSWYWLDASSGRMKTGWVSVSGADYWMRPSGAMATGWQSIGGSWYYFRGSGAMAKDCWIGNYRLGTDGVVMTSTRTPDGYYVGPDGKWDGKQRVA